MSDELTVARSIVTAAKLSGFTECGIIRINEMRGYLGALQKRIARFPESEPLYRSFRPFATPEEAVPWAKSIAVCVSWYPKVPESITMFFG